MEKEFVPYELEVKIKELGCYKSFKTVIKEKLYYVDSGGNETDDYFYKDKIIEGILWQQAFDWFREKGFDSCIDAISYIGYEEIGYWTYRVKRLSNTRSYKFNSYEQARYACLEKLIELIQNKNDRSI